jgi:hypothetical protein
VEEQKDKFHKILDKLNQDLMEQLFTENAFLAMREYFAKLVNLGISSKTILTQVVSHAKINLI